MKHQPLPKGIKFAFTNITKPDTVEIQFSLHIFMGDEAIFDEPVLYKVVSTFGLDDEDDYYSYSSSELHDQHDIRPYNHIELEETLEKRIDELLETCSLDYNSSLSEQLEQFLCEYGGNQQLQFFL